MSGRIERFSSAATSQRPLETHSTGTSSLPVELVTEILRHLASKYDLWQAAAVSRMFYAGSWQAGLMIERRILWDETCYDPKLAVFSEIVQHAERNARVRLGLSFSVVHGQVRTPEEGRSHYESLLPEMPRVFACLTAALPVLVRLHFTLNVYFSALLQPVLRCAAPRLEDFGLFLHAVTDRNVPTVPCDLFAGEAPQLRTVTLRDAYLGPTPIASFARVTHLSLTYCDSFPDTALAPHYPCLADLCLEFYCDTAWAGPLRRVDLRGLRLRRLCVTDDATGPLMSAVVRSVDLRAVPDVEHEGDTVEWTQPTWDATAALSVRICRRSDILGGTTVVLAPETAGPRRWCRVHHARNWAPDTLAPLVTLPGADARVTRLRIDGAYLPRLLRTAGLRLGALRELRADLDPALPGVASADTLVDLGCVNLQTLWLCVRAWHVELDASAVAGLGYALGLRLPNRRAGLVLAGVWLAGESALLDETFVSVRAVSYGCCESDWDSRHCV